jgi:transcriptional regulator with XRE-family HTH domain
MRPAHTHTVGPRDDHNEAKLRHQNAAFFRTLRASWSHRFHHASDTLLMTKARRATDWWRDNSAAAARHLNELRDAAQLSVEQLAEKARVDRRTVYRLLRESVKAPQVETLTNLFTALGTDTQRFKAGIGLVTEEIAQPSSLDVRQSVTSTNGAYTADFHTSRPERSLIWNLPQTQNFKFTGRDDYFRALDAPSEAHTAPRIDALVGLGGVGKSHICVEYAFRHSDDFDVIWWIRGSDPTTLQTDYGALAKLWHSLTTQRRHPTRSCAFGPGSRNATDGCLSSTTPIARSA